MKRTVREEDDPIIYGIVLTLNIPKLMRNQIWSLDSYVPPEGTLRRIEVNEPFYEEMSEEQWKNMTPVVVRFANAGKDVTRSYRKAWESDLTELHFDDLETAGIGSILAGHGSSRIRDRTDYGPGGQNPAILVHNWAMLFYDNLEDFGFDANEIEGLPGGGSYYPRLALSPSMIYNLWKDGVETLVIHINVDDMETWFDTLSEGEQIYRRIPKGDMDIPKYKTWRGGATMLHLINFPLQFVNRLFFRSG